MSLSPLGSVLDTLPGSHLGSWRTQIRQVMSDKNTPSHAAGSYYCRRWRLPSHSFDYILGFMAWLGVLVLRVLKT